MATAVETSSQPQAPSPPASLVMASLLGAIYVVAALAVVFYAVPAVWSQYVTPSLDPALSWPAFLARVVVQIAAAIGLGWFGQSLAGHNPPKGLRGGIFLTLVAAAVIFIIVQTVALWAEGAAMEGAVAQIVTAVVGLLLIFGAYRLLTSPRGERWMDGLEEQGWFHASGYKKSLGQKVRRLTILGLLLIGGSGVYSLYFQGTLPDAWTVRIPFTQVDGAPAGTNKTFTLLPDAKITIPVLLMALTLWIAYRTANMPIFAEFLIATEAEMNKVSWSNRKKLTQDTIVVLITTILMALFLLVVDLFWGWLLSRETVGVLPGKSTVTHKAGQVEKAKW
jgi:preprotein translocase SecE subunit